MSAAVAVVLPDHLLTKIKPDDQYLVRAQLTVPDAVLVTTDAPLRLIVREAGLPCLTREEFLAVVTPSGSGPAA